MSIFTTYQIMHYQFITWIPVLNFDLQLNVYCKARQRAKKLLVDDKITACVKEISVSQVLYAKFQIEEHFALLQTFAINIKFCAPSNLLFSCELLVGRQPPFLEWLCIVIILKSDWSTLSRWPGYGSRTVNMLWHILVNQMASKI